METLLHKLQNESSVTRTHYVFSKSPENSNLFDVVDTNNGETRKNITYAEVLQLIHEKITLEETSSFVPK